jgi:hypothetical protein
MLINVYKIYTGPLSVQAQYSRFCPIFSSFRYNDSLVTWTAVCLTAAKFKPLIITMPGFALSNIAEHLRYHDFVWLLLVACIILSCSHIHTKFWTPYVNRGPVCALEDCQHTSTIRQPFSVESVQTVILKTTGATQAVSGQQSPSEYQTLPTIL